MERCVLNLNYCADIDCIDSFIPRDCLVVTIIDAKIAEIYGKYFPTPQIRVVASENNKSLQSVESISLQLLEMGVDRSSFLLAVGGGVISDLVGFIGSIYMRGIKFAYVPTTLLAQVDAAIGGKTAVNLSGFKNILGVVNQPAFTLICPEFLNSLPKNEMLAGLSEMLKTFIIADRDNYFNFLGEVRSRQLEAKILWPFIKKCSSIKASIVEQDPFDNGVRKLLNLGHTFAHALEKITQLHHGEAVSIGIILASKLSVKLSLLQSDEELTIESDFKDLGLPVASPVKLSSLTDVMLKDKKKTGGNLDLILIESIGKAIIYSINVKDLEGLLNDLS